MNIYAIGCDQLSFRHSGSLLNHPHFKGVILTDDIKHSRWFDINSKISISLEKFLSLVLTKKESFTIVSFYDFSCGINFTEYLRKKLKGINIIDWYQFALQENLKILYTPAQEERKQFIANGPKYESLKSKFQDELSKRTIETLMKAYINKDRFLLTSVYVDFELEFCNRISGDLSIKPNNNEIFVDIGAWDGDTVIKFVDIVNGQYQAIYAFEPIASKFKMLQSKKKYIKNLHVYNMILSDKSDEVYFDDSLGMGSSISKIPPHAESSKRQTRALDDLISKCSLVKIDAEGYESKILEGMTRLIREYHPKLAVDTNHYPNDIFNIVNIVSKIYSYKNISIRLHCPDFHGGVIYFYD